MGKRAVLAVGSVALDTIETPHGRRENLLGGSSIFFSLSARHFAPVRLVGVVGEDFPPEHRELLAGSGIDLEGLRVERGGKTFRWEGSYEGSMSVARTVSVELNVLESFDPVLPQGHRDSEFALLGNCSPRVQKNVLDQLTSPEFVLMDSMNFWIEQSRDEVLAMARRAGVLCLNYEETLMLAGRPILSQAVDDLLARGIRALIVKKAEHGALVATREFWFQLPAYPTREVVDPTGAGDSFAGGVLGFLAGAGLTSENLKRALVYGTVMGSFAVEGFGTIRLQGLTRAEIERRASALLEMASL
jgi:sugar/nucleoside kinase (ribokinase family)